MNLSKPDLESWIANLEEMELTFLDSEKSKEDMGKYTEWVKSQQRKVAPGFNFDIMTPTEKK